ncbi:hypothetical protein EYZ11_013281 [Aspergillus tanneri]|uniref:Uncharacterized protein n=1 Tax=Aspergillus tanneri TaxID=1220188 RepID=A0A4V3UMH1_9EURO|nr:hypothetical protein EYZ11_013281 [Aspergillus tanneri]
MLLIFPIKEAYEAFHAQEDEGIMDYNGFGEEEVRFTVYRNWTSSATAACAGV